MATSSLKSLPSVLRLISVLPSPFHCLIIASNQCQVSSKQHILNSRKDSLCTPMTNSTELYPTIGCIWPSLYFTDQLLAKQLTAAPHNKSPSSGILLWDLWASGCLFFSPSCFQPTHQILKAVLRGKAMLYNGKFFHMGAPFIDSQ